MQIIYNVWQKMTYHKKQTKNELPPFKYLVPLHLHVNNLYIMFLPQKYFDLVQYNFLTF